MTSGYYWFRDKSKLIKTRFSMTGFDFNQIGDKLVFTWRLYCNTDGKILFFLDILNCIQVFFFAPFYVRPSAFTNGLALPWIRLDIVVKKDGEYVPVYSILYGLFKYRSESQISKKCYNSWKLHILNDGSKRANNVIPYVQLLCYLNWGPTYF